MKFGALILILSTPAAWAGFGNVVPNSSIPHRPCGQTTFERSADLLHKAALMAVKDDHGNVIKDKDGLYKDTRMNLLDSGEKLSGKLALSRAELTDLNNATASVECAGEVGVGKKSSVKNASAGIERGMGSGFLYGNGEQFATAAHTLFDSEGNLYKSCVLRAGANSEMKDRIPLDMSMVEIIKDPSGKSGSSIAIVKLKSKPYKPNGSPLEGIELNRSGRPVDFDQKVGMVSALQFKGDRNQAGVRKEMVGGPGQQPLVQECRRPFDSRITKTPVFYGECTSTPGASGAYGYSRRDGKINVDVIFTGGGKGDLDGTTFDLDKGQFAYGVILDSDKVNRMMEFQERRKLQGMEANVGRKGF